MKLVDVEKIYNKGQDNEHVALENVTIEFENRGLVFIEGQSGSGKTTLLNIISGLDKPTSGKLENDYGENYCSMVFQDFQLIDSLTVEENLDLVMDIMPNSLKDKSELVKKYGLENILDHYPNQISGGEKQRVAIVRAILENRPLIICDEPTGNLDEDNSVKIADLLFSESKDRLVVVASHDTELFINRCNHHLVIKRGKIVCDEIINQLPDEDIKINTQNEVKLNLKTQINLSLNLSKKFKKKSIFLTFAIFLSLIIILTSLNGLLNTKATVIYNAYKKINEPYIEFLYDGPLGPTKFTESDYQKLIKDNALEYKFIDNYSYSIVDRSNEDFEEIAIISRMYLSDECKKELLVGKSNIKDGGVMISDYIASKIKDYYKLKNYDEVLNYKLIYNLPIIGIYKTGYLDSDKSEEKGYLECLYQTAYMQEDVYNKIALSNVKEFSTTTESNKIVFLRTTIYNNEYSSEIKPRYQVLYGEEGKLTNTEVALNIAFVERFGGKEEEYVGKKITIKYFNYRANIYSSYDVKEIEYTIKFIYNDGRGNPTIQLSQDNYNENKLRYDNSYHQMDWGAGIKASDRKTINKLVKDGFIDVSYVSEDIDAGTKWLSTLNLLELAIGVILLIITIIVICYHISSVLDKEKRVLGILVSFGIPVKKTILVYLFNIILYLFGALIFTILFEILIVHAINLMIIKIGVTRIDLLTYQILSPLLITLFLIILVSYFYLYTSSKLKKKSIVDIIYER